MPDDPFVELADQATVEAAARARARGRWLRQQAEESATLIGTLVDLAERGRFTSITTMTGRAHRGILTDVGRDFCRIRTETGSDVLVALEAITLVRPESGVPVPLGDRPPAADVRLSEALARLVAVRPRVQVATRAPGTTVTGELRAVGADVVTVRVDGAETPAYVPLSSVSDVAVLRSG